MMKQVITSWQMLGEKLEEHKLHRTYCATCQGNFQKDHALVMLSQKYSVQITSSARG